MKTIIIQSTMYLPLNDSGHVFFVPRPCTVVGGFIESTGTIILKTVLCDGRSYDMLEISADDLQKFNEELRDSVTTLEF